MKLHHDRQGCALAALRLVDDPTTPLGAVIDFDDETKYDLEMATVLSAAVWVGTVLVSQVSLLTGLPRDEVIATLRTEVLDVFTNPHQGDAA
jgi:hypothetical protein